METEIPKRNSGSIVLRASGYRQLANESYDDAKDRLQKSLERLRTFGIVKEGQPRPLTTKETAIAYRLHQLELERLLAEEEERHLVASCQHPEDLTTNVPETIIDAVSAKETIAHTCLICGTRWRTILGDAPRTFALVPTKW